MIKRLLLTGLLAFVLGMPLMNAQEIDNEPPTRRRTPNKFALGFQVPSNILKLGAGLRFSYDASEVVRLSLDGNYYFSTLGNYNRRLLDVNPNVNLVFGAGDFHFYVIMGLYFVIGTPWLLPIDQMILGFGLNTGFGVEYQFTDHFRAFLDQQASLGLVSSWMPKLGIAYCF